MLSFFKDMGDTLDTLDKLYTAFPKSYEIPNLKQVTKKRVYGNPADNYLSIKSCWRL